MTDREKFEGFKQQLIEENENKYGGEIRAKYGDEAVNKSYSKVKGMTPKNMKKSPSLGRR